MEFAEYSNQSSSDTWCDSINYFAFRYDNYSAIYNASWVYRILSLLWNMPDYGVIP